MQQSKLDLNSLRLLISLIDQTIDNTITDFEGKYDKNEKGKDDVDIARFHQTNIGFLLEAKRFLDQADSKIHDVEQNIWARE